MSVETETLDKLFLELSQFTNATTAKELALQKNWNDVMEFIDHKKLLGEFQDFISGPPPPEIFKI